jgi:hypothetical protein
MYQIPGFIKNATYLQVNYSGVCCNSDMGSGENYILGIYGDCTLKDSGVVC